MSTFLSLPSIVNDDMLLQAGAAFPLRGRSEPGARVRAAFAGAALECEAGADGRWAIDLPPLPPGITDDLVIRAETAGGEAVRAARRALTGDLWLCSGQSNMELPMERLADDYPQEMRETCAEIRQFKLPALYNFDCPQSVLFGGRWDSLSPASAARFSGTGLFFAKALRERLGRPVGFINASMGGSPVEAWMSARALAAAGYEEKAAQGKRWANRAFRKAVIERAAGAVEAWEREAREYDAGLAGRWCDPASPGAKDAAGWRPITLPGAFADKAPPLRSFRGVLWLTRGFTLPAAVSGPASLWLGTIADSDEAYVNGIKVGETGYRYPPRKYPLPPGLLRAGSNTITLRVTCRDGQGELTEEKPCCIFQGGLRAPDILARLEGEWKYRAGCLMRERPPEFFIKWQPTGLFNRMISPLAPYPLRGACFYQGESNTDNPAPYAALFKAMIKDWRAALTSADGETLPFVWAQLPCFGRPDAPGWQEIRDAQKAALELPAAAMAVTFGFGEWNDLHPVNKKDVGLALADAAERVLQSYSIEGERYEK